MSCLLTNWCDTCFLFSRKLPASLFWHVVYDCDSTTLSHVASLCLFCWVHIANAQENTSTAWSADGPANFGGFDSFAVVPTHPPNLPKWSSLEKHIIPTQFSQIACMYWLYVPHLIRKRTEYCFESTVSEKWTHWASLSFTANSVSSAKNSVSSLWHTNTRLRGAHWDPELGEGQKTHWARCLKPCSPKPYSARFRLMVA